MASLFQRHCSDETLISHLDGELPFYARTPVRRHLERCWRCRLRLSEVESQVLLVTRAMENDLFPGPERAAEARLRFLGQADRVADKVFCRQAAKRRRAPRQALVWAAATVVLLTVASVWTVARRDTRSVALTTIHRVEDAEARALREPIHQQFRVVEVQTRPLTDRRERRLEVWSDPGQGRFATAFRDGRGGVQHAVWQPAPDRQYVYRAVRSAKVVRISREKAVESWDLLRDGMTLEDLESGLLTWLENRSWRPVSLSKALASLASSDGATLTVEETVSGGRAAKRLTAAKTVEGVTAEFVLDVDAKSYAPRLQTVRYSSPARTLELQLYSEEVAPTMPLSFEPPAESPVAAASASPPAVGKEPAPVGLPATDDASLEVEIYRRLHRAQACFGEPVEVVALPGGGFEVRGIVAGPERRDELAATLGSFSDPRVTVRIRSAHEALREIRPEHVQSGEPSTAQAQRPKVPGWLSRQLGVGEREAEEFAERAISAGEALMTEAQALRQLRERFSGRAGFEPEQLRREIEQMERDHLNALAQRVDSVRRLLAPVLSVLTVAPAPRQREELLARVFELSKSVNDRLRNLMLGADAASYELGASIGELESTTAILLTARPD